MYKVTSASTVALVDPQNVSQMMSSIDRNKQHINKKVYSQPIPISDPG